MKLLDFKINFDIYHILVADTLVFLKTLVLQTISQKVFF